MAIERKGKITMKGTPLTLIGPELKLESAEIANTRNSLQWPKCSFNKPTQRRHSYLHRRISFSPFRNLAPLCDERACPPRSRRRL